MVNQLTSGLTIRVYYEYIHYLYRIFDEFCGQEAQALLQMKGLIHRGFNVTLACHIDSQIAHEAKK